MGDEDSFEVYTEALTDPVGGGSGGASPTGEQVRQGAVIDTHSDSESSL